MYVAIMDQNDVMQCMILDMFTKDESLIYFLKKSTMSKMENFYVQFLNNFH